MPTTPDDSATQTLVHLLARQPAGVPVVATDAQLRHLLGGVSQRSLHRALHRVKVEGLATYTELQRGPNPTGQPRLRTITPNWHALHDAVGVTS